MKETDLESEVVDKSLQNPQSCGVLVIDRPRLIASKSAYLV